MKHFNQIERYLNHEMQEDERLAFEEALDRDAELYKEFLIQKTEQEALQVMAFKELHTYIHTTKPAKRSIITFRNIFLIAAALIFIATIGYFVTRQPEAAPTQITDKDQTIPSPPQVDTTQQTPKPETPPSFPSAPKPVISQVNYQQIAMNMLEQESNSMVTRSSIDTSNQNSADYRLWLKAVNYFKQEQYDSLYALVKKLPNDYQLASDIYFLQAQALLHSQQFDSAYDHLLALQKANDNPFETERNDYFLLLARIGRLPKDKQQSLRFLDSIASDAGHTYYLKAKKIKEAL